MPYIIFILLAFVLFGCDKKFEYAFKDANLSISDNKEKTLSKRHLEYWDNRSKNNLNLSYAYEMPYQKFIKPFSWYEKFHEDNRKYFYMTQEKIEIIDVTKAFVTTKFKYESTVYTFKDPWFYVNGIWYHQYKMSKLP